MNLNLGRVYRPHCVRPLLTTSVKLLVGGVVASWLVRSTPKRTVRVRALARDIVLCSWARHFTLTVPLSTQVYKWVPANLMLGCNPAMDWHPIQGGVDILLVASCYRNRDKLRPGGPHWPVCRLYLYLWEVIVILILLNRVEYKSGTNRRSNFKIGQVQAHD